jgi:hypothetical protein
VLLASKDNKGWNSPPLRNDALDDTGPLLVALPYCLRPSSTLRAYDNRSYQYNANHKARFVKVVDVMSRIAHLALVFSTRRN